MYTNEKIYVPAVEEEVHISRIVASFVNVMVKSDDEFKEMLRGAFTEWLKTLGISQKERRRIMNYITCGKLELEKNLSTIVNGEDWDSSNYADD